MTTPLANIPRSTVPAAKKYIVDLLSQNVTPNANPSWQLLVSYDVPNTNQPAEIVIVGGVERMTRPFQMIGSGAAGWIYEEYDLEVIIRVLHGGDDAQDSYERAWEIIGLVEASVRSDPSLGGLVDQAFPARTRDVTADWDQSGKGRLYVLQHFIHIEASI